MSEWRGFLVESKAYQAYESMGTVEKLSFWMAYPAAFLRFMWSGRKN